MANSNEVPAGFRLDTDTTTVGDIEYPVEYLQAETLDSLVEYYVGQGNSREKAEAIVVGVWNSHNKQGAIQSPKAGIRKAQDDPEADVDEAIADAQTTTRQFVTGAPRQRTGGTTKKQAGEMGVAIAEATAEKGSPLTKGELDEIMAEYLDL